MTIIISLDECKAIHPKIIMEKIENKNTKKSGGTWSIENEIKPSDLYCYLGAKFGPPNGIQNFLRNDHSDNLIHWDWTLEHKNGLIIILGMNMRTEIHLFGDWDFQNCDKQQFIDYIKRDFKNYGKEMSHIRTNFLEDWDVFINPYKQLKDAITQLKIDIDALALNPNMEKIPNPTVGDDFDKVKSDWAELASKYNRGIGLSMAIRAMTPVLAESFINLLLFILCRQDIKNNERLYNAAVRSNIDIKVQSLHINCIGFKQAVDWNSKECKQYSQIINERNDMLHGNISIDKLKFSEIYFIDKVPVFKNYQDIWQQSIGVSINSSGIEKVSSNLDIVNSFISYVLSCLEEDIKNHMEITINRRDLGLNKKTKHIGLLLPEHVVDFMIPLVSDKQN
jgi:hypothetical protein